MCILRHNWEYLTNAHLVWTLKNNASSNPANKIKYKRMWAEVYRCTKCKIYGHKLGDSIIADKQEDIMALCANQDRDKVCVVTGDACRDLDIDVNCPHYEIPADPVDGICTGEE